MLRILIYKWKIINEIENKILKVNIAYANYCCAYKNKPFIWQSIMLF